MYALKIFILTNMKEKFARYFCSTGFFALFYLIVLSFLVRFPSFFKDVINWDESTFILLGQSLLDGHLPYTELWDLKPPLLWGAFALFILTLGKSIISVRVAGTICVALIAWFTYLIGSDIRSSKVGLISGTLVVFGASLIGVEFSAVLSEHVALVPMMAAILVLVRQRIGIKQLSLIGFLMLTASMIRLNLAYTALAIGIALLFIPPIQERNFISITRTIILRGSAYALGGLAVIALTFLPYVITNQTHLFWQSVVLAPLSYSGSKYSSFGALKIHLRKVFNLFLDRSIIFSHLPSSQSVITILIFLGGLLGILLTVIRWKKLGSWERRGNILITIAFISTSISILKGGEAFSHYWIQIIPFLSLFAALVYEPILRKKFLWQTMPVAFLLSIYIISGTFQGYRSVISQAQAGLDLRSGPAYEIANYFKELGVEKRPIYLMTYHITYWLIDAKPLTRSSTHPSNIAREHLLRFSMGSETTANMALAEVFEKKPEFVVTVPKIGYLRGNVAAQGLLGRTLQNDYGLIKEIEGIQIYKRSDTRV
ncbi:MAG TPA: hypothetical protein V6C63_18015 [Allocoleopsis sp.]